MTLISEPLRLFFSTIIIFYSFLSSARACMTFGENPYIDMALSFILIFVIPKSWYHITRIKLYAAIALGIAAMWTMHGTDNVYTAYTAQLSMVLIPIILIFLRSEKQVAIFTTLCKWYAVLTLFSVFWWSLHLLGIPLPHYSEVRSWEYDNYGTRVNNYILFQEFLRLNPYNSGGAYDRFMGYFLEPGHMGTITAFLLFANRFDLKKWYCVAYLFIICVTLSAAAYTLTAIGFVMSEFCKGNTKIFIAVFIISILVILVAFYNDGDNKINEVILGKLTRDSGAIDGRFSDKTLFLWSKTIQSDTILFGLGNKALDSMPTSAGYKVYIITQGIMGATLLVLAYYLIYRTKRTRIGYFMYLLYLISFLQRAYPFWDAFIDTYILGLSYLSLTTINDSDKRTHKNRYQPKRFIRQITPF